jgi:hypothetical protein
MKTELKAAGPVVPIAYSMTRNTETGQATVSFTYQCPHCGKVHKAREIFSAIPANFHTVGYSLDCGFVYVQMPWIAAAPVNVAREIVRQSSKPKKHSYNPTFFVDGKPVRKRA